MDQMDQRDPTRRARRARGRAAHAVAREGETGPVSLPPFETVVAEHGPTVLRVCRAVLGPVAAEDAWSETFLAALRAWPRLRPDSDIRAWLVTIAHRKALDQARAQARRAVPVADPPEPPQRPSDDGRPGEDELWAALADLPPRQRQAVAYHHLAGLPYAEVAAVIGGSAEAARKAASDGIARLRAALTGPAGIEKGAHQ